MRVRFLSSLLLTLGIGILFVLPLRYLIFKPDELLVRLKVALCAVCIVLGLYWLVRRGHYRLTSALIIVLGSSIILVAALLISPQHPHNVLNYLVIITLFAGVFIAPTAALLTFGVQIMLLVPLWWLAENRASTSETLEVLSFLALTAVITYLITAFYQRVVQAKQARLEDNLQIFQALFERSSDAVFIIGMDGRLKAVNQRVTDILGYTQAELQTMTYQALVAPEERAHSQHILAQLHSGQHIPIYERTFINKAGEAVPAELSVALVTDTLGRPLHIQSMMRDLRERRAAENKRLQQQAENERLMVLRRFVDAVSHDFRNSLSIIETSRYLIERALPNETQIITAPRMARIQEGIDHMKQQLDNVRLIASLMNIVTTPTDLNELLEALYTHYHHSAEANGIALMFHPFPALPRISCDSREIGHAIKQLIDNALAHTPPGGCISLQTRLHQGAAQIIVADSGSGIPDEHLPYIFEVFYRADEARSLLTGGLGLGLSMVRMIADAHDGDIAVETCPGQGSTFILSLPLKTA